MYCHVLGKEYVFHDYQQLNFQKAYTAIRWTAILVMAMGQNKREILRKARFNETINYKKM